MLSDNNIRELLNKEIFIEPYDQSCLEPASYDCKVGRVLLPGRGIVDPERERVVLRMGDWAELETLERFKLSKNIAASWGLRTSLTRAGIDWFGGPHIDPGYRGKLYVSVFNPTSEPFEVKPSMRFATLTFYRLAQPASREYGGEFQNQETFPEKDIIRILNMKGPTLADVVISVNILQKAVESLTESTKLMARDISWVKYLLGAILIALVIGIGIGITLAFVGM